MNRVIWTGWLLLSFVLTGLGQEGPEGVFESGNALYQEGDYNGAIDQYRRILEDSLASAALYYNLGNAYFKVDDLPRAILFLERAHKMAPFDREIRHNLDLANARIDSDFGMVRDFFLIRFWRNTRKLMRPTGWILSTSLSLCLTFALFSVWLLGRERSYKKAGFLAGCVLAVISGFLLVMSSSSYRYWETGNEAIVMTNEELKFAPDEISEEIIRIPEGLKVRIVDQLGDWCKVELSDKNSGWVPSQSLERI
jgi:tetratricopeptide (TPR) repeat protein